jgi:uncharacterized membrane protein
MAWGKLGRCAASNRKEVAKEATPMQLSKRQSVMDQVGVKSEHRLAVPWWLWTLILCYAVTYGVLSVAKHNTFHSWTYDLGIMSQVLWNTAHGRLFEISLDRALDTELIGSYLGNHVRPILLILAPLYRVWPDPRLLLGLQSAALALAAVPLFWIARRKLTNRWLQLGLLASYFLYPSLGHLNLFDFHPVALSIPVLFVAYWALLEDRSWLFWLAILLALATKEEMVIPIAAFGAYCFTQPKVRRYGLGLLLLAGLWAFLCFFVIVPHYNEGHPYRFFRLWSMLSSQLTATSQVTAPGQGGTQGLLLTDAVVFIGNLLLPLGFLPLLGPGLLATALPSLAYLLLSKDPRLHTIGYQYPAVLVPWLFLATTEGMAKFERWARTYQRASIYRWSLCLLLVGMLFGSTVANPILLNGLMGNFRPVLHKEQIQTALTRIPPDAGVATINVFGSHLATRRYLVGLDLYTSPLRWDHLQYIDYILLDLTDCRAMTAPDPRVTYAQMVYEILDSQQFRVDYWSPPILLLQRGHPDEKELEDIRTYVEQLVLAGRACWP